MNLYGEVIGIVSAKYSSYSNTTVEGIGFAIPISDVQTIITDIMENGQVTDKAYMAIKAGSMTEQMAAQYNIDVTKGVFVYAVEKGGAGEKAGLQLGDVITKLNDTDITSMSDLSMAKKSYKAGDTVTPYRVARRPGDHPEPPTFDQQPQTTGTEDDSSNQNQGQQDSLRRPVRLLLRPGQRRPRQLRGSVTASPEASLDIFRISLYSLFLLSSFFL